MSVKQYLCGPCLEEKAEIEGVVNCKECDEPLCGQCKQDHVKIKVSKHHTLCDIADVPPEEIKELLKSLLACPNHEKEEVVYLCKDHDMTCCNKCAMADHRKCEVVKVLSDILNDIKEDCSGLKTVLHDFQQQGERLLEHERNHEALVFEIENQALASLQTIKQKLLDIYAHLENEVLSAIADKKKEIGEKIKTNNEKARQFLNDIKQQSTYIELVQKFGMNEHVVLLQRRLKKNLVCRMKSAICELEKSRSKSSFKCVEDTSFDSLLIEVKNSLRIENFTCDVTETGSDTDNSQYKPYTERILQLQCTKDLSTMPLFNKEKRPYANSCIWIDKYIVLALRLVNALLVIEEYSDFTASDLTLSVVKKFRLRIYLSAEFFQNMREWSVPYDSPFQKIFQSPLPYICIPSNCTLPLRDATWYSSTRGTWKVYTFFGVTTVAYIEADISPYSKTANLPCSEATVATTCPDVILGNYRIDYEITVTSSSTAHQTRAQTRL
ncbi:uncharacterized protein LOC127840009 [Dreissena polymorpha]|uniref:uncharacterized protein LOC127840009 n=1 Tax=Dreissena polymorpha TaxID=45954 RepID=UPI002264F6CC|nr:uncharacterized protein LOC127840009 [Dreissena polymorpha]